MYLKKKKNACSYLVILDGAAENPKSLQINRNVVRNLRDSNCIAQNSTRSMCVILVSLTLVRKWHLARGYV